MGVIVLTLEPPEPTIVESPEQFDSEGTAVLILNLDRQQLEELTNSNVTYDLRVGDLYRDHRDSRATSLSDRDPSLDLPPGASVIIQTEESLHLPRSMFGHIVPRVSLLQRGLSNTFSKVDPGYQGPLLITVFNLGKRTIVLRRGEPFCAICFMRVEGKARLYGKRAAQIASDVSLSLRDRVRDWCARHQLRILLFFAALTLLQALYLIWSGTIR